MLAGDVQKTWQASPGRYERSVVTFFVEQLVDGDRLADDYIGLKFDSAKSQGLNFVGDDVFGQPEFWNAVISTPPSSWSASKTWTWWPIRSPAHASPAGPLPTMATFLRVRATFFGRPNCPLLRSQSATKRSS